MTPRRKSPIVHAEASEQKPVNDERETGDLNERQWGIVREDYITDKNVSNYLGHKHSQSGTNCCGEDGLARLSDDRLRLSFAFALRNGRNPILKEHLISVASGLAQR